MIPDDARELDRDVQAYRRELRALRRRQRASRLRRPLTRDGMVLPLLAGCLILALITSTLLIMFAADQTGMPGLPARTAAGPALPQHHATARSQPTTGQVGGPLPAAVLAIGGKPEPLSTVTAAGPSVLALIPLACPCASVLRQLGVQAARARVPLYLVGTGAGMKQVAQLAVQARQGSARVADDTRNVLGRTYRASGLTAILVRPGGSVASIARLATSQLPDLEASLRQLGPAG